MNYDSVTGEWFTIAKAGTLTTAPTGGTQLSTVPQDLGAILVSTDPATISGATTATPIVVTTSAAHGYTTGDAVNIINVGGITEANGSWLITVLSSTTFSLTGSVGAGTYTSGGKVQKVKKTKNPYNSLDAAWNAVKNNFQA